MEKLKSLFAQYYEKARQHKKIIWFILAVLAVAFVIYTVIWCYNLIFAYPVDQVSQITNVSEKADLVNKYRTTSVQIVAIIAQIFGAIAIFIGLFFAWGNLTTAREGQITERFTRAIDQLGNRKMEIRLGGIYALERIANESEKDYWSIMEILTAYVRNNSGIDSYSKDISLKNVPISMDIQANESNKNKVPKIRTISLDIQAILTVIVRRKYSYEHGETNELDFKETNLQQANLSKANLSKANLSEADLIGANLSEAELFKANLSEAELFKANLSEANLSEAELSEADLSKANLSEANLSEAELSEADLSKANLSGANLFRTDLSEANLSKANLIGANLSEAYLIGANLSKANLMRANLSEADLSKANLSEANLSGAKNLTIDQLSKVKTLYGAKIDEELGKPLREKYLTLFEKPTE